MGQVLEGCCKSNRNKSDNLDQAAIDELNGGSAQSLADSKKAKVAKEWEKDELFDQYIDENIDNPADNQEGSGELKFDYFLKIYQAALVWNRIKFAEKKAEMINERREALKNDVMERWRELY